MQTPETCTPETCTPETCTPETCTSVVIAEPNRPKRLRPEPVGSDELEATLERYALHKNLKETSISRYRSVVRMYAKHGFTSFDDESLALYRQQRLEDGKSPNTVHAEITKMVAIAKWLGLRPSVAPPRRQYKAPRAWSEPQIRDLLVEAGATKRTVYRIPGAIYWPALLWLAWDTGERLNAMLSLTWNDIDFKLRTVNYRAETRKFGAVEMLRPLSKKTAKSLFVLQRLLQQGAVERNEKFEHDSTVFKHGSDKALFKAFKSLLSDAGLPTGRNDMFHRLRKSHATHLHVAGGDATASLGHSNATVTRESYLDPLILGTNRRVLKLLPNPVGWWASAVVWWRNLW